MGTEFRILGPLEVTKPWSTRGIEGVARFLDRTWRLFVREDGRPSEALTADHLIAAPDRDLAQDADPRRGHDVLHLHRLERDDRVALVDRIA